MKRFTLLWMLLCLFATLSAQAPQGYYSDATGKSGRSLKTALHAIIKNHVQRSYDQLWEDFKETDVREDGKIWDMYSNTTSYVPGGSQQGKNYKSEGDSYNREHSFPKSWFNDAKPMYTDLFHLVPTDGYVNNRRSNYPFGETNNPKWTSDNSFSKLGPCSLSGYSGTVFEPNDEYKGDFARIYFYMATCYEDKIASWSSDMLAGNAYPAYEDWVVEMLLRWAEQDPVSQKEIDRNNAVYGIQKNRNPYVDYPGLERYVWGDKQSVAFNPDNYDDGTSTDPTDPTDPTIPAVPTFSPAGGTVLPGTQVTISCSTPGAYVYYTLDNGDLQVAYASATVTVEQPLTISAYSMLGENRSETVTASYTLQSTTPVTDRNVYVLITKSDELQAGANYLIVCPNKNRALGAQSTDYRGYADVTITDNTVTTQTGSDGQPYALTLGGTPGAWTFYDTVGGGYLALQSDKNKLHTSQTADEQNACWTITIGSDGVARIANAAYSERVLYYNATSPRFACYSASSQQPVALYRQQVASTSISAAATADGLVDVYTLEGRQVRSSVPQARALEGLAPGIYLVGGRKVLVR